MKLGAMAVTLPGSGLVTQTFPVDLPELHRILFGLRTGLSPVERLTRRINFDTGNAGTRPASVPTFKGLSPHQHESTRCQRNILGWDTMPLFDFCS